MVFAGTGIGEKTDESRKFLKESCGEGGGTALLRAAALAAGLAACGSSASSPAAASTTVDDSAIVDVGLVRTGEQACLLRIEEGSFGLVTVAPFTAVAGGLLLTRQNPKDQNSLRR